MPRPHSPLELLHAPSGKFPYKHWETDLRTYKRFRVHGFNDFMRIRARIFDFSFVENDAVVEEAKSIVEKEWIGFLPPTRLNGDDLNRLGKTQIQRVRKNNIVSFQSACVAIVALEIAIKKTGKKN